MSHNKNHKPNVDKQLITCLHCGSQAELQPIQNISFINICTVKYVKIYLFGKII